MSFSVLYDWCGEDCSEVTEECGVELALSVLYVLCAVDLAISVLYGLGGKWVESVEFGISELYVVVGYVVTFVLT
jgi:hypothetical protein